MTEESPWLTVNEAADILRCHPATLRVLIREGKIKATRLGRVYRIHRDVVMDGFEWRDAPAQEAAVEG
jgi:excisionase family DNA binding protein